MKEIRTLANSLSEEQFRVQMGPFALIQRPPVETKGQGLAAHAGTRKAHPEKMSHKMLSLLFEFEDLVVATLPPLNGVDQLSVGRLPDCDLVLDDSSGLRVDAVTDSVGSQIMPRGGADTGFGGTAPHPPANPAPWLLIIGTGALLTAASSVSLRRLRGAASARR